MLANIFASVFDSIPAGSKNNGAFPTTNVLDTWASLNRGVGYVFANFSTSAMDADLTLLKVQGSDDNTNWHDLADFTSVLVPHGTTQIQRYMAGISTKAGSYRRYLKWIATSGNGTNGVTAYGIFVCTNEQYAPASAAEVPCTAYIEVV